MKAIQLTLRPQTRFSVPLSTGYTTYAALLNVIEQHDSEASKEIHDQSYAGLHNSGLQGNFKSSSQNRRKTVCAGETYTLTVGIVDAESPAAKALLHSLVIEEHTLQLTQGALEIEEIRTEQTTQEQLVRKAGESSPHQLKFNFQTPTCIQEESLYGSSESRHRHASYPRSLPCSNLTRFI